MSDRQQAGTVHPGLLSSSLVQVTWQVADKTCMYELDLGHALIEATGAGRLDVVQLLVERGADINARNKNNSITPLIAASRNGHDVVVDYLCKKEAKVDKMDARGMTALRYATFCQFPRVVRALCEEKAMNSDQPQAGLTVLDIAVIFEEVAEILIHYGASAENKSKAGKKPKDIAKFFKTSSTFSDLLKNRKPSKTNKTSTLPVKTSNDKPARNTTYNLRDSTLKDPNTYQPLGENQPAQDIEIIKSDQDNEVPCLKDVCTKSETDSENAYYSSPKLYDGQYQRDSIITWDGYAQPGSDDESQINDNDGDNIGGQGQEESNGADSEDDSSNYINITSVLHSSTQLRSDHTDEETKESNDPSNSANKDTGDYSNIFMEKPTPKMTKAKAGQAGQGVHTTGDRREQQLTENMAAGEGNEEIGVSKPQRSFKSLGLRQRERSQSKPQASPSAGDKGQDGAAVEKPTGKQDQVPTTQISSVQTQQQHVSQAPGGVRKIPPVPPPKPGKSKGRSTCAAADGRAKPGKTSTCPNCCNTPQCFHIKKAIIYDAKGTFKIKEADCVSTGGEMYVNVPPERDSTDGSDDSSNRESSSSTESSNSDS